MSAQTRTQQQQINAMQRFAFISRHEPLESQHDLAESRGLSLTWVGDADAFTVSPDWVLSHGHFAGVIVVHPAAAMRLASHFIIGVFENTNRAPAGEKPQFEAAALHIYDKRFF